MAAPSKRSSTSKPPDDTRRFELLLALGTAQLDARRSDPSGRESLLRAAQIARDEGELLAAQHPARGIDRDDGRASAQLVGQRSRLALANVGVAVAAAGLHLGDPPRFVAHSELPDPLGVPVVERGDRLVARLADGEQPDPHR